MPTLAHRSARQPSRAVLASCAPPWTNRQDRPGGKDPRKRGHIASCMGRAEQFRLRTDLLGTRADHKIRTTIRSGPRAVRTGNGSLPFPCVQGGRVLAVPAAGRTTPLSAFPFPCARRVAGFEARPQTCTKMGPRMAKANPRGRATNSPILPRFTVSAERPPAPTRRVGQSFGHCAPMITVGFRLIASALSTIRPCIGSGEIFAKLH